MQAIHCSKNVFALSGYPFYIIWTLRIRSLVEKLCLPVLNSSQLARVGSRIAQSSYTKRTGSSCHRKMVIAGPPSKFWGIKSKFGGIKIKIWGYQIKDLVKISVKVLNRRKKWNSKLKNIH